MQKIYEMIYTALTEICTILEDWLFDQQDNMSVAE